MICVGFSLNGSDFVENEVGHVFMRYFPFFFSSVCVFVHLSSLPLQSEGDTFGRHGGFQRGTDSWWRQQHYNYEFVGSNGVLSMEAVQLALKTLKVTLIAPIISPVEVPPFCRSRTLVMPLLFVGPTYGW